jgi:hypothetical protein
MTDKAISPLRQGLRGDYGDTPLNSPKLDRLPEHLSRKTRLALLPGTPEFRTCTR